MKRSYGCLVLGILTWVNYPLGGFGALSIRILNGLGTIGFIGLILIFLKYVFAFLCLKVGITALKLGERNNVLFLGLLLGGVFWITVLAVEIYFLV